MASCIIHIMCIPQTQGLLVSVVCTYYKHKDSMSNLLHMNSDNCASFDFTNPCGKTCFMGEVRCLIDNVQT